MNIFTHFPNSFSNLNFLFIFKEKSPVTYFTRRFYEKEQRLSYLPLSSRCKTLAESEGKVRPLPSQKDQPNNALPWRTSSHSEDVLFFSGRTVSSLGLWRRSDSRTRTKIINGVKERIISTLNLMGLESKNSIKVWQKSSRRHTSRTSSKCYQPASMRSLCSIILPIFYCVRWDHLSLERKPRCDFNE